MELLNEDRQRELLSQPESGMGYQNVTIMLRDGEERRGIAFNTEYLLYPEEPVSLLQRIAEPSQRLVMLERKELGFGERILSLKVMPSETKLSSRVQESSLPKTTSPGADEAAEEELQQEQEFKRFSAYAKDRRVTPSRGLLPGTYATTAEDARQVKTGRDAVKRYALPNPKPAVHVFTIDPPIRTKLKRGIAQPAYGQPGGGVEVIFVNGSLDKTVTGPAQIPP